MKCKFCKKKLEEKDVYIVGIFKIHSFCVDGYIAQILGKQTEKRKKVEIDFVKVKKENKKSGAKKTASYWFNKFIRLRDENKACISCGKVRSSYHCGHFIPKSSGEQFYFNEENCHKQCAYCNIFLSGNLAKYRINLIKKIGIEAVENLEKLPPITDKRSVEFYKELAKEYRFKFKKLVCSKMEL